MIAINNEHFFIIRDLRIYYVDGIICFEDLCERIHTNINETIYLDIDNYKLILNDDTSFYVNIFKNDIERIKRKLVYYKRKDIIDSLI